MSRVSERVLDASPPVEDDREIRSLHVAPSLAMSTDVAEERDSQPAQRDELAVRRRRHEGEAQPPH